MVLLDLYLGSNYYPICKRGLSLYSNSDRAFAGRYYVLQEADERTLLEATSSNLLEILPKDDLGEYIEFTDVGLQAALQEFVPSRLDSILAGTQDSFLKTASRDADAVCELMERFEVDLIRARSFGASDFTYQNVVNALHKMMLDPKTATEHLTRQHNHRIRQKPIENNCSLFDLYVGQDARVLNSFEHGIFVSVRRDNSEYRLGKWHGSYNHLGDYNPLSYGRKSLAKADWLGLKIFEVYQQDYTLGALLDVLRNYEVSHSSLSRREPLKQMMEIANRNLRGCTTHIEGHAATMLRED